MPDPILIATSLAPGERIELQKKAIDSWLENGFQVQSYNEASEAEIICNNFPGVQFVSLDRTAKAHIGKPLVFISDILNDLRYTENNICGIVNSDIFFQNNPNLAAFLSKEASDAIVLGSRLEVEHFEDSSGKPDPFGFDYFFMPTDQIDKLSESEFVLGMPLWDYWLPFEAICQGIPAKRIVPPIGLHVSHDSAWGENIFAFGNIYVLSVVNGIRRQNGTGGWAGATAAFISYHHEQLRNKIQDYDADQDSEEVLMSHMTALAEFYDNISKFSFKFITERSDPINFS